VILFFITLFTGTMKFIFSLVIFGKITYVFDDSAFTAFFCFHIKNLTSPQAVGFPDVVQEIVV